MRRHYPLSISNSELIDLFLNVRVIASEKMCATDSTRIAGMVSRSGSVSVTTIDLKPEVVTEFRKATLPLWEQVGKRTEISGKLVSNLKAYLKAKGVKLD